MSKGSNTAISKHYSEIGKPIKYPKSLIKAKCIFSWKKRKRERKIMITIFRGNILTYESFTSKFRQLVHSLKPFVAWKYSCILRTAEQTLCSVPLLAPHVAQHCLSSVPVFSAATDHSHILRLCYKTHGSSLSLFISLMNHFKTITLLFFLRLVKYSGENRVLNCYTIVNNC